VAKLTLKPQVRPNIVIYFMKILQFRVEKAIEKESPEAKGGYFYAEYSLVRDRDYSHTN